MSAAERLQANILIPEYNWSSLFNEKLKKITMKRWAGWTTCREITSDEQGIYIHTHSFLLPALTLEDRSQLTDDDASELRLFQAWPMYKLLLNIMGGVIGGAIGLGGLWIVLTNPLIKPH